MASAATYLPLPRMLAEQLANEQDRLKFKSDLSGIAERALPHPEADSDTELELAADMYAVSLRLFKGLGPAALDILRADINEQLDSLMAEEYSTTETIRKLAYAHLREAVGVFGKFVERMAATVTELSYDVLIEILDEALSDRRVLVLELQTDLVGRNLAVTSLAIMLGLDSLRGDLSELTYWAKRAVESSRRVEPLLSDLVPHLTGNVSRLRAQHAWDSWDQAEVDREVNSWKSLID